MVAYTSSRLRYVSLALPMLLVALVFGLGARGVHAVPHGEAPELVSRDEFFSRDASSLVVKAPPSSSFFLNGLKGQRPTTRRYNFVISELTGAPDGFSKPMLVVNGTHRASLHDTMADRFAGQWPGPTIEANQGDRLVITVTNFLSKNHT